MAKPRYAKTHVSESRANNIYSGAQSFIFKLLCKFRKKTYTLDIINQSILTPDKQIQFNLNGMLIAKKGNAE